MQNEYLEIMTQLVQRGKCWTDNTFLAREMLISHKLLTAAELAYVDSRWSMYDELLSSATWQQLMVLIAAYSASQQFIALDWLVLIYGFGQKTFDNKTKCAKSIFNEDVVLKGIDESSLFDDALKNTRILEALFKLAVVKFPNYIRIYALKVCAHMLKKFPQLEKHSANMCKMKRRVKFSDIEKFLNLS